MRYLSVCSGIEAATQAWHPLGWEPVAFSEIEAFPSAVLAHHYPHVPNWGDMTKFKEWPDADVDVLVGGTPCQSFSVAGLRKGLADPRGNLMLTYLAIADRYRPRWLLWENVPGVLSSNSGRDFGAFLGGLGQLGYGFAYRVLDAQYVRTCGKPYAVPQRRRRVFVVGYLGDWRRAAAVLIDREGLRGDSPPRRKAGQIAAPTISSRPTGGGGLGTDFDCDGGLIAAEVAPTLNAHFGDKMGLENQHINGGCGLFVAAVTNALTAHNGQRNEISDMTNQPVAHSLRGEGHDASENGTGRGVPLIAFSGIDNGNDAANDVTPTLRKGGDGGQGQAMAIAIQERAISDNPNAGPDGVGVRTDGASYTIEARQVPQAVAFAQNTRDEVRLFGGDGASVGALAAEPGMKQQAYVAQPVCWSLMPQNSGKDFKARQVEVAQPLMAGGPVGGNQGGDLVQAWTVRRLTPVECERLQAFPDQFTRIPYRGKPAEQCPDGPRYKALGNSMAVNVMQLIGERIAIVEKLQ